jgi:hypothetical protein
MIPKLEEYAEVENLDAVDTRSDQSGSGEEISTLSAASATSILDLQYFSAYFSIYR